VADRTAGWKSGSGGPDQYVRDWWSPGGGVNLVSYEAFVPVVHNPRWVL
jgi:hypothetical protein